MPRTSFAVGVAALAAAVVLPVGAQAEHQNRYFGFGFQPFPQTYAPPPPPVLYELPPGVRETAPGVYEYQVSPGRWVRFNPGFSYRPRRERARVQQPPEQAPAAVEAPDEMDDPEVAVESPPESTEPDQPATKKKTATARAVSCEDAAAIVESFGFSDVQSTSCSGAVYGFDASRDGNDYSIKLSAADGELTEVRKR